MTVKSGRSYPGATGVVGFLSDERLATAIPLVQSEIDSLSADVSTLFAERPYRDAFVDDLIHAAEALRWHEAISDENRLENRRHNLRRFIRCREKGLKAGVRPLVQLSVVNRGAMRDLARTRDVHEVTEVELAKALLTILKRKRSGRGDRPHDELDFAALHVKEALERHTDLPVSCTKEGAFVFLLNSVVGIATRVPRSDMHRVAERVIKSGRVYEESPGVRIMIPPRFAD